MDIDKNLSDILLAAKQHKSQFSELIAETKRRREAERLAKQREDRKVTTVFTKDTNWVLTDDDDDDDWGQAKRRSTRKRGERKVYTEDAEEVVLSEDDDGGQAAAPSASVGVPPHSETHDEDSNEDGSSGLWSVTVMATEDVAERDAAATTTDDEVYTEASSGESDHLVSSRQPKDGDNPTVSSLHGEDTTDHLISSRSSEDGDDPAVSSPRGEKTTDHLVSSRLTEDGDDPAVSSLAREDTDLTAGGATGNHSCPTSRYGAMYIISTEFLHCLIISI